MSTMEAFPAGPVGVDLDALYAAPAERIQKAVLDRLVDVHEQYLAAGADILITYHGRQALAEGWL